MRLHKLVCRSVFIAVVLLSAASLGGMPSKQPGEQGMLALLAPAPVTYAAQSDVMSMLSEEAGMSAYVNMSMTVDLESAENVFRTIEDETEKYVIGSVLVEGYLESDEAHVFVSSDGWFVAYYPVSDPAAKIIDWRAYGQSRETIPTKLEKVLEVVVAGMVGRASVPPSHYDFRYPDATELMFIVDYDSFTIQLPASFTFYEISCSGYSSEGFASILVDSNWCYNATAITAADMLPGIVHTVQRPNEAWYAGLALVYKKE